jgi:uncharacterized protein (TIGR02246 family)
MEPRHRNWIAAVNATDIVGYAQLVTEDVVWLPPHGDAVVGRAAFKSWLEPFFGSYAYEFSVDDIHACETDRWIAETGEFRSRMTPLAGGAAASHGGRYFAIWRREADVWRIERYVDRASLQPA